MSSRASTSRLRLSHTDIALLHLNNTEQQQQKHTVSGLYWKGYELEILTLFLLES